MIVPCFTSFSSLDTRFLNFLYSLGLSGICRFLSFCRILSRIFVIFNILLLIHGLSLSFISSQLLFLLGACLFVKEFKSCKNLLYLFTSKSLFSRWETSISLINLNLNKSQQLQNLVSQSDSPCECSDSTHPNSIFTATGSLISPRIVCWP